MSKRLSLALALVTAAGCAHAAVTCYIKQSGTVAFTSYDMSATAPNDAALSVVVGCDRDSGPADVSVELAVGPSSVSGMTATRRLRQVGGAGYLLNYNLYRNSGRSLVWGNTSGLDTVVQTIANVPNKGSATTTFTIYGRIPIQQDVAAGSYIDSVQITVNP